MSAVVADGFLKVADLSDLPQEEGRCFSVNGRKIALFRDGDKVHAIDNVCPHEGAPLAEGFYEDGIVICPLHAWEFDVTSGRVVNGSERIEVYPARILSDGSVEVLVKD